MKNNFIPGPGRLGKVHNLAVMWCSTKKLKGYYNMCARAKEYVFTTEEVESALR